ncbi:MAG: TMEM165/GDT1 family protein [Firmicutes bacterium]|nr:TMEM165/GDT1 family protein [Bacillota bacterium]
MIYEMGKAALLIFLAELGDKTQILAMAFALQFSVRQVLAGVALGSFLNHGLAVIIGAYLAHIIPISTIRLGSALLFLAFGLWTLRSADEEDDDAKRSSRHPILVVALAFFLGELGDKTQLTAIALASNALFPGAILAGTVLGMVLTSLGGIFVGTKLGDRIPDLALKLISSAVLIGFGLFHLSQTVPTEFLTVPNVVVFLAIVVAIVAVLIIPPLQQRRKAETSSGKLKQVAAELYALEQVLNQICINDPTCRGERCPLGYCKRLIKEELSGINDYKRRFRVVKPYVKKDQKFDQRKLEKALKILEKADLNPAVYTEVKTNLEKLFHRV